MDIETLKTWLAGNGLTIEVNSLSDENNLAKWYAWKRSSMKARRCEQNGNENPQIVVHPFLFRHSGLPNGQYESCAVEIVGEYGGVWYRLSAYSMSPDELVENLDSVENSLVRAWRALGSDEG
jgi:hypothetical protein